MTGRSATSTARAVTLGAGPAPVAVPLPEAVGPRDAVTRLRAHGCWYPSASPDGTEAAFICDRGGVPQLWAGPVQSDEVRLLDASPDPVTEVSWSPDGRWIAYTAAPGGGEHSRVLCVRPDGTGRRILAGADPDTSAYLGCWAHDGSAVAVTVAVPAVRTSGDGSPDGTATSLEGPAPRPGDGLSAYLLDPDGLASPALLATEADAATLRVCDLSFDGTLALLRRGPRGRREAVVRRTADSATTCTMPVADGDPWIGRFSHDGRTLWLRTDADREFAALYALELDADGAPRAATPAAQRPGSGLELLSMAQDGRTAVLVWNVQGASELELLETTSARSAADTTGPARPVPLPHEVVTRAVPAGAGRLLLALSGSRRRPGVWWAREGVSLLRTPWSSRDEDAVPPDRPPVRPVPLHLDRKSVV